MKLNHTVSQNMLDVLKSKSINNLMKVTRKYKNLFLCHIHKNAETQVIRQMNLPMSNLTISLDD